jgi:hypothetical protein
MNCIIKDIKDKTILYCGEFNKIPKDLLNRFYVYDSIENGQETYYIK